MKNIFISFIVILVTAFKLEALDTKASHAILLDYDTNTVLYEKNADVKMAPSSMSKLMTIYIVFEKLKNGSLSLNQEFPVNETAWRQTGSKMFLNHNQRVKLEDLLRGIIVQSGNDATVAIAEGIMGSEEYFVREMNLKATELGLKNSHFANSNGMPNSGHYMSSRDLAKLSSYIIRDFPEYYHYFNEKEFTYNKIKQQNRNDLLGIYKEVDGIKTGHADKAGYGIAASASNGKRRVIAVVNGFKSAKERAIETEFLLKYGLNYFENIVLAKNGEVISKIDTVYGSKDQADIGSNQDIIITLPKEDLKKLKLKINYESPLSTPIKKGQEAGSLQLLLNENIIEEKKLFVLDDVSKLSFFGRIFYNIKKLFE